MPEISDILDGNQRAGAQMIRLIEEDDPEAFDLLKSLYPHSGKAFIIGITGSPGVGKSTIIDKLIAEFRKSDFSVAVIAVDPTSPFSGGAILGDRLRMQGHATDEKVFIRSMASRGQTGGISRAAKDAVIVLDAMGYEIIIIETVGAGQSEFEVSNLAHSTGIVNIPGTCDGIQAVKAGILETGDIFIVNKSDTDGADVTVNQLTMVTDLSNGTGWKPKVFKTIAHDGTGMKEVAAAFLSHWGFMKTNDLLDIKKRAQETIYFTSLLKDLTLKKLLLFMETSLEYQEVLQKLRSHEINPLNAAEQMVKKINLP